MAKSNHDENTQEIANAILKKYQPKNVEEMQDALKEIFSPMFEAMLQVRWIII